MVERPSERRRAEVLIPVLGALAALATLAFSVAGAVGFDRAREVEVEDEVDRAGASAAVAVGEALDAAVADLVAVARSGGGEADTTAFVAVGGVAVGPAGRIALGELGELGDPLERPGVAAALDLARDTAAPVVSAPIADGDRATPVVVVALYGDPTSPSLEPERSGFGRRDEVVAWVIGLLDTERLLAATVSRVGDADVVLELREGSTRLAATEGEIRFGETVIEVSALDRAWALVAGAPTAPTPPAAAWALASGGGFVALVLLAMTRAAWTRHRRRVADAYRLAEQMRVVSEIAPVVQQSLDLDVVLPAACLRIVDELDLAGASCSVTGESGRQVEVFSVGADVDATVPAQLGLPAELDRDETVAVSLERGGRAVGTLRVRTGRPLDRDELVPLAAVAELTTAAIVNARLFEEQRATVERLRQVDQLKTVFLGTASHELRTPVTAIVGFAKLLETSWDRMDDERRRGMAARIAANAIALDGLVSDLLDFARLERGSLRAAADPVDLSALVERLLERIEPVHTEHDLVADIADDVWMLGDATGLERIVANLVSNAVKFSPSGSAVRVAVSRTLDDRAEVVVDDEGPGVAEADRERIFSRFFRGAGEEVVRTRGAGIGLSVVAEFAEQMNGEVTVTDSPAGGARFQIRFPAVDPVSIDAGDADAVPSEPRRSP